MPKSHCHTAVLCVSLPSHYPPTSSHLHTHILLSSPTPALFFPSRKGYLSAFITRHLLYHHRSLSFANLFVISSKFLKNCAGPEFDGFHSVCCRLFRSVPNLADAKTLVCAIRSAQRAWCVQNRHVIVFVPFKDRFFEFSTSNTTERGCERTWML